MRGVVGFTNMGERILCTSITSQGCVHQTCIIVLITQDRAI